MKKSNAEVSIIMPAFNAATTIKKSIESVFQQTFRDWILIVVDDNSSDLTYSIVESYKKIDNRIILLKTPLHEKKGPYFPRNYGLKYANTRFIAFLDADDIWYKNKLELQIKLHKTHKVSMSCSAYRKNFKNRRLITITPPSISKKNIFLKNFIPMLTVIFDTNYLPNKEVLSFPAIPHEDYALWLKLYKNEILINCYTLTEPLAEYNVTSNSVSANKFISVYWTYGCFRFAGLSIIESFLYCIRCVIINISEKYISRILYIIK